MKKYEKTHKLSNDTKRFMKIINKMKFINFSINVFDVCLQFAESFNIA